MTDGGSTRARYRRILRFAARYMLQAWWFELFLPRIGLGSFAARGRARRLQRLARNFHTLAVALGGLMIKVGQFMSSRLDVLPPVITKELEGLQDEVPPVDFEAIRALAESELQASLSTVFEEVEPIPLAAASLGQAHRARLVAAEATHAGFTDVVVKVQRPGIDQIVDVDLAALRRVAAWLSRVRVVREHVDLPALLDEFAVTSLEEIDYLHEAANAERFREDFADDTRVATPQVAWERSTRRVLTLEDVTAIKINDRDALREAGIDPREVAHEFAAVMFEQLFTNGYFHADPHPGNVFVTPTPDGPRPWTLTFIDFGMMGEVPDRLRRGLQQVIIAVASRNGRHLVESIRDVGVLLPSADTGELERAMTTLFARFGGMGFAELQEVDPREFRDFAMEFRDLVRRMPFQLPENFLLVIRAVSLTSGVCSALDPAFNIWEAVEPYAQRLIRDERGNLVQAFASEAASVAGLVARMPRRVDDVLTRLEDGRLAVDSPRLDARVRGLETLARRVVSAVLFAGLLIAGAVLRPDDPVAGTALMFASVPALLHALLAGILARRLP
ncbi:ABC1 kinase family protein [Microbacterium aquimaris]|uniref:AarF/UbiB family protein n=1 Tax=Microbacterium aquimaris TaxID=459816 RepID=A0ABU5N8Y1_9MICO|nr:AarF/UbiB family protein [Microbacterium aquimaris]MDZ8162533.1 AarF/UbiB family protein [Microbacterium aquimaris]